jgi:uncharacterized membrane protein YfcA
MPCRADYALMENFAEISLAGWCAIAAVMAFAGFMQGSLGLGFPTVATPLLAMWLGMPRAIVLILLPCLAVVAVNVFLGPPLRQLLARFWFMPVAMLIGAALGGTLFVAAPYAPYSLVLAGVIFLYLVLDRLGPGESVTVQRHPLPFGVAAAAIGGAFEATANVAAPPLVMYYSALGLAPAALVQGLNLCFMTGKLTQFAVLSMSGLVSVAQWLATLPLVAVAVAAGLAGVRVRDRLDAKTYRKWLKGFLFAVAVMLLGQYLWRIAA